jgi:hypothetical protein
MMIEAPWSVEQVVALNQWQERGDVHPFTCGAGDSGTHPVLVAHHDGWHCPACIYRQNWAHDFMALSSPSPAPPPDKERP